MKKLNFLIPLLIAGTISFSSCKKDDNGASGTGPDLTPVLTSGTWRVSYYHHASDDHTSNFSGYTFAFNANGTLNAVNSGSTTSGTWSQDDSHNELHLSMGNSSPLSDLNKGWLILSGSSTEIVLTDDNLTHNEEVHFTKI